MSTRHRPAASRTMAIRTGRTQTGSAGRPRTSERARPRTSKPAGRGGAAVEVDMTSTVAAACKSRLLKREDEAKTVPQRIRNGRPHEAVALGPEPIPDFAPASWAPAPPVNPGFDPASWAPEPPV